MALDSPQSKAALEAYKIIVTFTALVDLPFRGQTSVSPRPIARVLATVLDRSQCYCWTVSSGGD